jgi:hypothetical protein
MDIEDIRSVYLDLMERALLGLIYEDDPQDPWTGNKFQPELRQEGRDWPSMAHSMIGSLRMHNLRTLTQDVVARGIPGDFIETGVWRGGACIMMRAVLKSFGDTTRRVWVCDSFEGLPPPDPKNFPSDKDDVHVTYEALAVSLEQVRANFAKYGLLDNQVQFLKGWFKDTLPNAPVEKLAILRLDGDMYESTIQALDALYRKLSPGGYVIIDDLGAVAACKQAVIDFRVKHGISTPVTAIDWTGAYWRKE